MRKVRYTGTILIYTMVLTVVSVSMAVVILNISTDFSLQYDKQKLDIALYATMKSKADLSMKHSRELNTNGGSLNDVISCPSSLNMLGNTNSGSVSTTLRIIDDIPRCQGVYNGAELNIYFNSDFTDLRYAELAGSQVALNSTSTSGTFFDSDNTNISLPNTAYSTTNDGIDDNFDDDNYMPTSIDNIYPDGYIDNDANARIEQFGYIVDRSGLYNILWSNSLTNAYIDENPYNSVGNVFDKIGDTNDGVLNLEFEGGYKLFLYRIDKNQYLNTRELIITEAIFGDAQSEGGIGYLQDDMTLSTSKTGSEYIFDFTTHDYAIFAENLYGDTLLFRVKAESDSTGKPLYINPIREDDPTTFSYLSTHMYIGADGRLIGDTIELFGLKNDAPVSWISSDGVCTFSLPSFDFCIFD